MSKKKKRQKRKLSKKAVYICAIITFVAIGLGAQTVSLFQKRAAYAKQEEALTEELEIQQAKAQELEEYEKYVQTGEYVEETAKEKLGMVYDNEIIFREKK